MPNHVINNIRISGDPALIRELLESVQADEQSLGSIDFNKIIPMPESLKIECGSNTDKGLKAFTDFTQVYTLAGTREDADIENIPKEAEKAFLRIRSDITPEQWSLGKLAYENQCKYGVPTWYEWSINNWGTKWNAYECAPNEFSDNSTELNFWTAWAPPHPVLQMLSEQYPELEIFHEWADEDIGMNCGRREYKSGDLIYEYYPEGDEATDFACELWGLDPSEETDSPVMEM